MTKIIIYDYSLEIVIVIIYDHHNLHYIMFIPLFEAAACHIFRYENTLNEKPLWYNASNVNYTVYWIGFFVK